MERKGKQGGEKWGEAVVSSSEERRENRKERRWEIQGEGWEWAGLVA